MSAGASAAVAPAPEILLLGETESAPLRRFYLEEMRPFLEQPKSRGRRLADEARATSVFAGLRTLLPAAVHNTLGDLEEICDEARQLLRQERLHRWRMAGCCCATASLALILLGASTR